MKTLEACYEIDFSNVEFLERKLRITHPKTLLQGPPKCGKSYLIYDYLAQFQTDEYVYIDFEDFKNSIEYVQLNLEEFIKDNNIRVLVLENYEFNIKIPTCESIIITTKEPKDLFGFKTLQLMPLDFEEFLLHDNHHQNTTNAFNHFLKYGNLPEIIHIPEFAKTKRLQEVLRLYAKDTTSLEILKLLLDCSDEKKSIYQLFSTLKKSHKISKDKFYEMCKIYEQNRLLYFIQKYQQPKATKKIYTYNHAFLSALSHQKKFKNEFTNMVFLELIKEYKEIYYLDHIDFYMPQDNKAILALPFFNHLLMSNLKRKVFSTLKELHITQLYIITIGNEEQFKQDKIDVQVLPFYEWALLN